MGSSSCSILNLFLSVSKKNIIANLSTHLYRFEKGFSLAIMYEFWACPCQHCPLDTILFLSMRCKALWHFNTVPRSPGLC